MRTFVAVPLPKECQAMLDEQQRGLRSCGADVRWVAIPSIHLTLKFLGEAEPGSIARLTESLENVAKSHHGFDLRLHGLGCFPNSRNPRVLWCGIDGSTESLSQLQQEVESACASCGFAPETRPFHPHLTLGRVNGKRNLQALQDCIKIGSDLECSFKVDRFHLYQSTLRPQGALYTVLKTMALGGGP